MAVDHGGTDVSLLTTAAAILQYAIVKGHGTADSVLCSTTTSENHLGIAQEAGDGTAMTIKVRVGGTSKVLYGGTVYLGSPLTSAASGKAVVATAGQTIIGRALVGGVNGDIGECVICQASV